MQLPSEESVSEFIANHLRSVGISSIDEPILVEGKEVCREFFASLLGVSTHKIREAKKAACGSANPKRKKRMRPRTTDKQHIAISFWKHFFQRCQRPNKDTRLFPINLTMPVIYKRYFKPWFAKAFPEATNKDRPSLSTLKKARWTSKFKDVVKRKNHTHCRCSECYTLEARSKRGFQCPEEERQWEMDSELHTKAVDHFRECEKDWQIRAAHAPEKYNLFSFDDTGTLKLPHFSNRQPKNLPSARLELIPFLIEDHARGKKTYMYSTKGRYSKGANRICGQLYAAIEALKTDTSHVAHLARNLCLICDNFSENKNNTLFAMCSDLILNGWYDEVQLLYGPVGHTHSGIDQDHFVHNQTCGKFVAGDLGHFGTHFEDAWVDPAYRPSITVLECQYDFESYYTPFVRSLSGFTKTAKDPLIVTAWRFKKGTNGN
jgi:hypothetical protein